MRPVHPHRGSTCLIGCGSREAAAAFGLDADALAETVEAYNLMAQAGEDGQFGKAADFLVELGSPLYIMDYSTFYLNVGIGGIGTNRSFEAVDDHEQAIAGLYAVGVDGSMCYPVVYTINIPCSCCANNVYSARMAVRNAKAYLGI